MKIVVILRLEPALTEELELTDDARDVDREWIGLELNQFDDQALEQAVLLKESSGGASGASVTALAIQDEGSDRLLKTALARGADEAVCLSMDDDETESRSSRAMAPIYVSAIKDIQPDVVLVGVLSTGDLYGELGPYVASHLAWPQASAVSDVRLGEGTVTVRQEYAGGRAALIEMPTPAVIGLQTAAQPPRYVAGSKLRELLKTEIPMKSSDSEAGDDLADRTTLALPDLSGGATMMEGDTAAIAAQIRDLLKDRGFV